MTTEEFASTTENKLIQNDRFTTGVGLMIIMLGMIGLLLIFYSNKPIEEKQFAGNALVALVTLSGVGISFSNRVNKII